MAVALSNPSIGLDRTTGGTVTGWEHVLQSIGVVFTTRIGERVLREWFGSAIPNLLGKQLTTREVVPFFAAMSAAIEMWEPRYRVTKITVLSATRTGTLSLYIEGAYRPRAVFGDFRVEGPRRLTLDFDQTGKIHVEEG